MSSFGHFFTKGFYDSEGNFEEVQLIKNSTGYGVDYSHPQHLKNYYGFNIKCFKDMDQALDQKEWIRALIEQDLITVNIGTKITPRLLQVIEDLFLNSDKPIRAKITSISRKHYKTFEEFKEGLKEKINYNEDEQEFKSHIEVLSQ